MLKKYYVWDVIETDGTLRAEGGYYNDIREAFEAAIESWASCAKDVHVREGTIEEERKYFYGVASHRVIKEGTRVKVKSYEEIKAMATKIEDYGDEELIFENFYQDQEEAFVKEMIPFCGQEFIVDFQEFDTRIHLRSEDSKNLYVKDWSFLNEWLIVISEGEKNE